MCVKETSNDTPQPQPRATAIKDHTLTLSRLGALLFYCSLSSPDQHLLMTQTKRTKATCRYRPKVKCENARKYKMKLLHKRKKIMEQYLCGNRNRFRGVVVDAKMNKTLIHLALTATSAAAETSFAWVDTTAVSSIVVLVVLVRKWRTIRLHTHTQRETYTHMHSISPKSIQRFEEIEQNPK